MIIPCSVDLCSGFSKLIVLLRRNASFEKSEQTVEAPRVVSLPLPHEMQGFYKKMRIQNQDSFQMRSVKNSGVFMHRIINLSTRSMFY